MEQVMSFSGSIGEEDFRELRSLLANLPLGGSLRVYLNDVDAKNSDFLISFLIQNGYVYQPEGGDQARCLEVRRPSYHGQLLP